MAEVAGATEGRDPSTRVRRGAGVRVRTTVAATLVVALAFTAGAVVLVLALGASLRGAAETSAENRAEEIADLLDAGGPAALPAESTERADDPADDRTGQDGRDGEDDREDDGEDEDVAEIAWQVAQDDAVVASSGSGGRLLPLGDTRTDLDGDPYVVVTERVEHEGTTYVVSGAASLEGADDSVAALWPLLAVGIPVAVLLVGATTWVVTGRALRPVERIRERVASIGSSALDQRVPVPPSRDEVARLAHTMNDMLERLETSATKQRQFVSDTSHELRSPLAGLRQTAEVARAHPDALEPGELTEAVLEETARMQHLVEQMLVLTRTEEGASTRRQADVDLDDLLLAEASRVRRAFPGVEVDSTGVAPVRAYGDGPALAQVVRNLVDNAVRHSAGALRLATTTPEPGWLEVAVEDDGSGVAPDQRERVFERFVRLDEARARDDGGSGLGLAIVREVARAHGGEARVDASPLGGARFVVRLPVAHDAS